MQHFNKVDKENAMGTNDSTNLIKSRNALVAKVILYIRENIAYKPGVAEIANHFNISRSTLHRWFIAELGHSPNDEITRHRMIWAKQLLQETNLSITEISNRLSFQAPCNFIRSFHTLFGVTPLEFRNKTQGFNSKYIEF